MKRSSRSTLPGLCLALAAVALLALPAGAGAIERPEYVERLEPICAANSKANSRILKGVKGQVQRGKLVPAGKRFIRASGALGRSIGQMARVPKPAADTAKLNTWFRFLRKQKLYLFKVGKALKTKKKGLAQRQAIQLNRNNNRANNTVISFGFRECRIDSSKFL